MLQTLITDSKNLILLTIIVIFSLMLLDAIQEKEPFEDNNLTQDILEQGKKTTLTIFDVVLITGGITFLILLLWIYKEFQISR